jgi:hypothetical protein
VPNALVLLTGLTRTDTARERALGRGTRAAAWPVRSVSSWAGS